MAKDYEEVEKMMEELGCTGEHISSSGIKAKIESIDFQTVELAGSKFMYCGIKMVGGFVVTGNPAACIDPENWREEIGRKVSFDNSFSQIWKLEAYLKMAPAPVPVKPGLTVEQIAEIAHETNRGYCESLGDKSQSSWGASLDWQKKSAITGVQFHIDHPSVTPEQYHESWLAQKLADGWKYGEVKDVDKKEHPCYLPYDMLPEDQKAKDYIFGAVVRSCYMADCPF